MANAHEVTKVTHTTETVNQQTLIAGARITQPDDFCLCVQFTILNSPSSHPLEQNLNHVPLNHDVWHTLAGSFPLAETGGLIV